MKILFPYRGATFIGLVLALTAITSVLISEKSSGLTFFNLSKKVQEAKVSGILCFVGMMMAIVSSGVGRYKKKKRDKDAADNLNLGPATDEEKIWIWEKRAMKIGGSMDTIIMLLLIWFFLI